MSIIQKIQEKGAWIVFILIGLALIAFIMMDSSVRSGFGNTTTVGKVNGTKIEIDEFQQKVANVEKNANAQNMPHSQVVTGVWNYYVQSTLLNEAYDELGLAYTAKDMNMSLFGPNPPEFLRGFVNPETGAYDVNAAKNALAQLKRSGNTQQKQMINEYLEQQQEQLMMAKYQAMVFGAAYIPSWLLDKSMADDNAIAQVQYVAVPYTTIADSTVSVSDAEIDAYVKEHRKLFEQKEETRNISYVTFNASASSRDSAGIIATLKGMEDDFKAATDNAAFVASKDGNTQFYDGFLSAAAMQFPNKDIVIATPVGEVSAPYISNGNYVISKMVAKTTIPDSAKVRHILVATHQQDPSTGQLFPFRDDSSALKRLDSAIAEIKGGANFDSVALKYSDDPGSAQTGGVIDYFTSGMMMPEFNDFAFTGRTGQTKTIHTNFGFHYVEILGQKGSTEGYKVASVGRQIVPSQETIDSVSNVAAAFVASSPTFSQFEENAKKENKPVLPVQGLLENDFQVGNLGEGRDLVKWAYEHKVGEISQPEEIGENYVVAALTAIAKPGLPAAATVRPYLEQQLKNKKKAKLIIDSKFKGSSLEDYAKSAGVEVQTLDSLAFEASFVPSMGNEPALVGAAFNKNLLNKVSKPFAGTTAVFAIKPTSVSARSSLQGRDGVESRMRQTWFQQIQSRLLSALQQSAEIEDHRSTFY